MSHIPNYKNLTKYYLDHLHRELKAAGIDVDNPIFVVSWGGNGAFHVLYRGEQTIFSAKTKREVYEYVKAMRNGIRELRWLKREQSR